MTDKLTIWRHEAVESLDSHTGRFLQEACDRIEELEAKYSKLKAFDDGLIAEQAKNIKALEAQWDEQHARQHRMNTNTEQVCLAAQRFRRQLAGIEIRMLGEVSFENLDSLGAALDQLAAGKSNLE